MKGKASAKAGSDAKLEKTYYAGCPLCDSKLLADIVEAKCGYYELRKDILPEKLKWKRCDACTHIFQDGFFHKDFYDVVMGDTQPSTEVGSNYEQMRALFEKTIEKVLPFESEGIWIDVGFGDGGLLRTAQEYGFTPVGFDVRERQVNAIKSFGIMAYSNDISTVALDTTCRVVSMQYSLAHMPYPKLALEAARRFLGENGILVVSTPNAESSLWKEWDMTGKNPFWGEIVTYHNFTRTSLYRLLRQYGFEPIRYSIGLRWRGCMEVFARKI